MMTAFAIVRCPSHSFPNLMALVAASAFAPTASKVARTANRSRNMTILGLAKRHQSITTPPDLATMCAATLPTSGLFLASRGLIPARKDGELRILVGQMSQWRALVETGS